MATFSASKTSEATVAHSRDLVWDVLTDADTVARLTPMVASITPEGDRWRWQLTRIPVLGVSISPSFTELMAFDAPQRITFTHAPPEGRHERAAAEGWYQLDEVEGGTHLHIRLTVTVELPLARAATPAVRKVMETVMGHTGDRFSANLLRHLGVSR